MRRNLCLARKLSGEQVTVGYVYRDGHWTSGQTDAEGERLTPAPR